MDEKEISRQLRTIFEQRDIKHKCGLPNSTTRDKFKCFESQIYLLIARQLLWNTSSEFCFPSNEMLQLSLLTRSKDK